MLMVSGALQILMNVIMAITHVHLMLLVLILREVIIASATLDIWETVKVAQVRVKNVFISGTITFIMMFL